MLVLYGKLVPLIGSRHRKHLAFSAFVRFQGLSAPFAYHLPSSNITIPPRHIAKSTAKLTFLS